MIERLVQGGEYQNGSEVLREGLRLLAERDEERRLKMAALREAAKVGWDAIEAGHYQDFSSDDELRAHFRGLAKRALANRRG